VQSVFDADIDSTWQLRTRRLVDAMWQVRANGTPQWQRIFMAMGNARLRSLLRLRTRYSDDPAGVSTTLFVEEPSLPRYYFSDEIVSMRNDDDFVRSLSSAPHSPRVAFVEGAAPPAGKAAVLAYRETANSAFIDVDVAAPALLVMSVTPHRYWSAHVDGASLTLRPVNIGFQGAVIPAGRHRVTMHYRNPLFPPLILLALATTAALLAAIIFSHRHNEVPRNP
jgi:hypothetical protein